MKKKFAIVLALFLIAVVCSAGCIDPEDPVDPIDPVDPVDPVDPITPVDPVDPVVPTEEYSVMFMLNYGDAGAYTAETVKAGETVSKPATPTRSGYTFKGWFTAAEGGAAYDFTQPVNADVTLYAQWKKKSSSSSGGSSAPSTPTTPDTSCSHNWGVGDGWVEVNPATCTAPGLKERVCTLCSESETQEIPKLNHNMGAEVVLVPATCVEAGTNVSVCDYGCGETTTIPVAALGHKDADTDYVCDLCDVSLSTPEEGHTEHIFVLQSVEGNVGTLKCTGCDATTTEIYVAQVAGKYYTQFDWALDNATESDVLVLLVDANSEIPKKVAINLNGKNATFTYDNINNVTILSPKGEGTLEVTADGKTVVFGEKVVADNLLPVAVAYLYGAISNDPQNPFYQVVDVYTAEGLMWVSNLDKNGKYRPTPRGHDREMNIMADINMEGLNYYSIDGRQLHIDGNEHTISNLTCTQAALGRSGFISYCGAIEDLTLKNVVASGSQVGAFIGQTEGGSLSNCILSGNVKLTWEQCADSSYTEEYGAIGTLIGYTHAVTLTNVQIASDAVITLDMIELTETLSPKLSAFPIVGYGSQDVSVSGILQDGAKITVIYADGFQSVHTASETSYEISSAEGLGAFRDSVNAGETYKEQTVKLTENIDLKNEDWIPIGKSGAEFDGIFDGCGKTISNMKVSTDVKDPAGLFGQSPYYVKNVNLKNVDIKGHYKTGAIAGDGLCSRIENCHVDGGSITATPYNNDDANHVGGIVGYLSVEPEAFVKDCSVKNLVITAYRDVGGIVGTVTADTAATSGKVSGNTVSNVEIIADQTSEYNAVKAANAGDVIGRDTKGTAFDGVVNYIEDVTVIVKVKDGSGGITTTTETHAADERVAYVGSANGLATAVAAGKTDIWLAPGEYDVYGCDGKTLILTGTKDTVLKPMNEGEEGCDYAFGGSGVGYITFNGITIDTTANTGSYKGYAYMNAVYNNCYFVGGGFATINAGTYEFNNCNINLTGYIWSWGATQLNFTGCTFDGDSRSILAHGSANTVINIEGCTFAATAKGYTWDNQWVSAVEIDPTGTNTYTINFVGTNTITEYYSGWTRVKDGSTGHTITGLN